MFNVLVELTVLLVVSQALPTKFVRAKETAQMMKFLSLQWISAILIFQNKIYLILHSIMTIRNSHQMFVLLTLIFKIQRLPQLLVSDVN